jgi:phosphorylcholine metabolism protein LicD
MYNFVLNIFLFVVAKQIKKNTIDYKMIIEDYKKLLEVAREDNSDKYDVYKNADGLYTNKKGVTQNAKLRGIKRE